MRGTSGWHFLATLLVLAAVVYLTHAESVRRETADDQGLVTDASKDIARLRFPIVNCQTGAALTTELQLEYIRAFVAGENPPAAARCPAKP